MEKHGSSGCKTRAKRDKYTGKTRKNDTNMALEPAQNVAARGMSVVKRPEFRPFHDVAAGTHQSRHRNVIVGVYGMPEPAAA